MIRNIRGIMLAFLAVIVMLPTMAFADEKTATAIEEEKVQALEPEEEDRKPSSEPQQPGQAEADDQASLEQKLLAQIKEILPIILGMTGNDPSGSKEWIVDQAKKIVRNPEQYSEDFWDSIFGTGADGISKEGDEEEKGRVEFVMELPDPVEMPDTYSISYQRLDEDGNEVMTLLERDGDGNIHYLDGENEQVFVKTEEGFRMYPVLPDGAGFGEWDGVLLSARSVREKTDHFWNCADQTFIKWLGVTFMEATEYLGRPCSLYRAEPGTIIFTYRCDLVIDDETGVCLCYTADELLKGAVYNITEENTIEIDIGDYDIGGDEMNYYCTAFETENVSFDLPEASPAV